MDAAVSQANPFDAFPPIAIGGGDSASHGGGNPFDAFPPIDLNAKAPTVTSPHPGALANSPDDSYLKSVGKGAATAAIKGAGDIPGVLGNLGNAADMAGDYGMATMQTLGGFRGSISEQAQKNAAAREAVHAGMRKDGFPVPSDYVPTGETFSNPVLKKTGEYVPESPLGRIGMAGVEAGVGDGAFGSGVLGKVGQVAANALGGGVGQSVTEATGNPMLGMVAGAGGQSAAHLGANVVRHGTSVITDAIPPITEAQKALIARRQVGQELNASATDPVAAQAALASGNREIIPGSQGTTGPISNDLGLLNYEKGVAQSPAGKPLYDARLAEQNAARQAAVSGIQPSGDVLALPETIRGNAAEADAASQAAVEGAKAKAAQHGALVDQATRAHVEGAQQAHQSALADIHALKPDASPQDVASHFRSLRDAMETEGAKRAGAQQGAADQARAAASPIANTPEQAGAALRTPFDAKADAASKAVSRLYAALPKDLVAPTFGIVSKAREIMNGMLPEHSPIGGEEGRLYGLVQGYGDEMPLTNVNALRGSILSARSALRQSDPQAYGRLGQLLPSIEGALDHAIENRAALDNIAVRRGTMAPEDAIGQRVDRFWKEDQDRINYNLNAGAERYAENAGQSASGNASGNGAPSAGGGRSGGANGNPGISERAGSANAGVPARQSRGLVTSLPNTPRDISLNSYLASLGGLKPSPELNKLFDKEIPSFGGRKLIRAGGMNLNDALQAAKDGGYMFDPAGIGRGELTLGDNDIFDKIAEDHRGGSVFPHGSANEDWHMALEGRAHEKTLRSVLKDVGVNAEKLDRRIIQGAVSHMLDGDEPLDAFGKASSEFHNAKFGPTTEEAQPRKVPPEPEEATAPAAQWEVKGSPELREANAAYREKKQTFDEGIGEAFAKVGRGQNAFSNAELAGKVFHGRPTAGEDMRAYLKATGPEGVPAASDAAALSFRDAAMRDGVVDPAKAAQWLEKHKVALSELPANVRSRFESAGSAQRAVEETMAKTRDNLSSFDKSEAGKVAGLSADGDVVKYVGTILDSNARPEAKLAELSQKAAGNPAAIDGLKRATIEHVLDKFVPEGGEAKTDKMQSYVAMKRDVLSKVLSPAEIDALGSKAASATAAGEGVKAAVSGREEALKGVQKAGDAAVKGVEASRKEILARYDKGALGALKSITGSEGDVVNTVRRVLNADNGATQMALLAKEAAKTPEGMQALKRAVAEVVRKDVQSTSEAGASGVMQMKRAELAKFMAKRTEALKAAGLSDQQIGVLRAVTEDGLQANRIVSATAAKGGSDTAQNRAMAAKMGHGGAQSILGHIIVDSALAGAGHMAGGLFGAFLGKSLGDKVVGAMREAGLDRVQKLRVEAILHPDVGLALMKEFPNRPNHGTAAALGLRLRQLNLAGILAAQKQ